MFTFLRKNILDLVRYGSNTTSTLKNCTNYLSTACNRNLFSINSNNLSSSKTLLSQDLISSCLLKQHQNSTPELTQVRNWGYKGRMMLKDIKRRELLRKFAPERIRLQSVRANTILPKVIKKAAQEQLQKLTKHSTLGYITNRCALTSKAGGCLHRWHLSRHVWRLLADYNQLSGVARATWGVTSRRAVTFTFRKNKRSWFNYDGNRMISYVDRDGSHQKQRFKLV